MNDIIGQFMSLVKNNKKKVMILPILIISIMILWFSFNVEEQSNPTAFNNNEVKGYSITYNDSELGIVKKQEDIKIASDQAYEMLVTELGYDPELNLDISFNIVEESELNYIDTVELSQVLKEKYYQSIDKFKKSAFKVRIDEETFVILQNESDIEAVIENVERNVVGSKVNIDVTVNLESQDEVVVTNVAKELRVEEVSETRILSTSSLGSDNDSNDNEEIDAIESEDTEEQSEVEESEGTIVSIDFLETIEISEVYAFEEEILDVQKATELLTKENEEPSIYTVVSGDVPSIIAENNDMTLSELYSLNEGIEENERTLQIDDELIVMVPEPELSVITEETLVYTKPIAKDYSYIDDPETYVGSNKTINYGYDGVSQVTATITKINGYEQERVITDEIVITEPQNAIISVGSKSLPSKGSVGNFVSPLAEYTLTSAFGYRWNAQHRGIDMAISYGTSVRASDGGVVTYAGWNGGYGYLVEIDHGNGVVTRYGHNSKVLVSVGQEVSQYQEIAKVGSTGNSTGPHVHFEIIFDGVCANPLDYI